MAFTWTTVPSKPRRLVSLYLSIICISHLYLSPSPLELINVPSLHPTTHPQLCKFSIISICSFISLTQTIYCTFTFTPFTHSECCQWVRTRPLWGVTVCWGWWSAGRCWSAGGWGVSQWAQMGGIE